MSPAGLNKGLTSAAKGEFPGPQSGMFSRWMDAVQRSYSALTAGGVGSGGGSAFVHPNRYDLSVNGARVEGAGSAPLLITQTNVANAGAYNGGGTGNKSILGFKGHAGLPLGQVRSLVWEWQQVSQEAVPFLLYANMIVDLGAPPGVVVFTVDPAEAGPLNTGILTTLGPGHFRFDHTPGTHFVQVVRPLQPNTFAPVPVPNAPGSVPPDWHDVAFRYSDILAAFPNARLVDASTLDGGLPKATVTPALMILAGDSGNVLHHVEQLLATRLNGADA